MKPRKFAKKLNLSNCLPRHYVLVIAEKPKAAKRIAEALSKYENYYGTSTGLFRGYLRRCTYSGVIFWVLLFQDKALVIAPVAGHMFTLHTLHDGFPVFDYLWKPIFELDSSASHLRKYYNLISFLAKRAIGFINACDYDIEGSLIGYLVLKLIAGVEQYYRAVFSALTPTDIVRAFTRLKPADYTMVEAGHARHELDWLWGINVSRALMYSLIPYTGRKIILSAGRVQSPTLLAVVRRERERSLFIPLPFFEVYAYIEVGSRKVRASFGTYESLAKAKHVFNKLKETRYLIVADKTTSLIVKSPPPPFNLGDLQAEAARIYSYNPSKVQEIAEKLYLEALISYPRTNSQKIPPSINVRGIVKSLSSINEYASLCNELLSLSIELKPREGSKTDPAHPAIYPTGETRGVYRLNIHERRIYDLIVRRFLASMYPSFKLSKEIIWLSSPDGTLKTSINTISVLEKGWLKPYPFIKITSEKPLDIQKGDTVKIYRVVLSNKYTLPPARYTRSSLVRWMERVGIGTEATRARIVDTLFERGYLASSSRGSIKVTELGFTVAEILEKYFPQLTDVSLTREFEQLLEDIRAGKRTREEVVSSAKKLLELIIKDYKAKYMKSAGLELAKALGLVKPSHKCVLCPKEAHVSSPVPLCKNHYEALRILDKGFEEWRKRIDKKGLSFEEYLAFIVKSKYSGKWVKDVARLLLSTKGRKDPA